MKSVELTEILEKRVANGYAQILDQSHSQAQTLKVLQGFIDCHHSRSKIVYFLVDRVVRDFDGYSLGQKCQFVR